jgi:hypothetical protein
MRAEKHMASAASRGEHNKANARLAADIGGTFTDIAVFDDKTGEISFGKALSTPARLVDGIAGIQAEAQAFVCVFSGSQSHPRFDALARELRRTLTGHLDRIFAEAFPRLPDDDRARMLAAWSDITGAMIANLDRSKPGERGKLLEELKTILGAYLDAKLAAVG